MALKRPLQAVEARVLGVLVEKQSTVPDSYPLSLNALTMGCNQKTARDPVMNVSEAEVLQAIDGLKDQALVNEVSGSRVVRFEHNMQRGVGVPTQSAVLLTLLMLRGPQTAAELRLNTERLHRFADISSVEAFLDEMASHDPPFVVKLARAPGEREPRWAHLLCGDVPMQRAASGAGASEAVSAPDSGEIAALKSEQARLAVEVAQLRSLVQRIAAELGIEGGASGA
ncbi:MAG TPA: YceH family protein [Burkholderiaceae bacterium]|nr:YceH family protein [Burkholderiaceae bacterium]